MKNWWRAFASHLTAQGPIQRKIKTALKLSKILFEGAVDILPKSQTTAAKLSKNQTTAAELSKNQYTADPTSAGRE